MPTHNELYAKVVDALRAMFEDLSIPASEIYEDLGRIIDNAQIMRAALDDGSFKPSTLKNEEEKG